MLSRKRVVHIDLNSLFIEMAAKNENIPETFNKFITELGYDDMEWGDVRMLFFNEYLEEENYELIKTIQDFLSFYHNIYEEEICLEMNIIALY